MSSIYEARSLLQTARQWAKEGHQVAMATLVGVQGSAYRRPGAKMIMGSHGRMQGTLSGGCLEGDLFVWAEAAMKDGRVRLQHYDLTEDEMWGLGIGCKGKVSVWITPVAFHTPFWEHFGQALEEDRPLVWGVKLPDGQPYLAHPGEPWVGGSIPYPASDLATMGPSGDRDGYWWDVIRPPQRLVLAGAGHDARPLAEVSRQAGFEVVVLDPREAFNTPKNFPGVHHRVAFADQVSPNEFPESFWVVMNHHQRRDEQAIWLASQSRPKFLGVLGPRTRTQEMLHNLGLKAEDLPLHSPVGLDVGAESAEEVALSIVAELMMALSGATGGPLNGRERIHP